MQTRQVDGAGTEFAGGERCACLYGMVADEQVFFDGGRVEGSLCEVLITF
jgi:hypothetical protein